MSAAPHRSSAERAARAERADRWALWLYGGHLFTLFGIALSNIVTGVLVLATPWALRRRRSLAPPRDAWPLLTALGLYILLLWAAIAASADPGASLRAGGEAFTLITLVLGLYLVRGERPARWVVDGLSVVAGLVALAGLVQLLVGYGALDRRIRGPFSHWMTFSGFLLLCDLLLVARLVCGPRPSPPFAGRRAPGGAGRLPTGGGRPWRRSTWPSSAASPAAPGWRCSPP